MDSNHQSTRLPKAMATTNNEMARGNENDPSSSSTFIKTLLAILPFTREGIRAKHAEAELGRCD